MSKTPQYSNFSNSGETTSYQLCNNLEQGSPNVFYGGPDNWKNDEGCNQHGSILANQNWRSRKNKNLSSAFRISHERMYVYNKTLSENAMSAKRWWHLTYFYQANFGSGKPDLAGHSLVALGFETVAFVI